MTAKTSTQQEWFSNYASSTMSILGAHAPDADGDLPVSGETCMAWVPTETSDPWGVRVFALAARNPPLKAAVYKEIRANGAELGYDVRGLSLSSTRLQELAPPAGRTTSTARSSTTTSELDIAGF